MTKSIFIKFILAFSLISSLIITLVYANDNYKVDVTVHYEFICPHSRALVIEQAIPAWRKLSSIMNLELIPYGNTKAKIKDNSTVPPKLEFICQHGKRECEGDLLSVSNQLKFILQLKSLIFVELKFNLMFHLTIKHMCL